MLASTIELLHAARAARRAVGGFNVYNLEGVLAVVAAAEACRQPAILQLHPAALAYGGPPLLAAALEAAHRSAAPLAVHLDHSDSLEAIQGALDAGVRSVMADGSQRDDAANERFTRAAVERARAAGAVVEAEIGRLSGSEDGLTVAEYEARLTDPARAAAFVAATGVDMLAVCIGNAHGPYRQPPQLDFARLAAIREALDIPLVLHGASGLPEAQVRQAIRLGVCKLNVNTELREAYLGALRDELAGEAPELLGVMRRAVGAMQAVAEAKIRLFAGI
jgi:tagatose 1,6-diphosphate aldolase GatY/KbaY